MIDAKIILDSVTEAGHRLTTFQLRYPRFIHAELLTHRVFSRNASSSRAVPVKKMIEDIRKEAAMPMWWGKNQPGMQADVECDNRVLFKIYDDPEDDYDALPREHAWLREALHACNRAEAWDKAGYHKQIVNRLLEPYSYINVIVSATEFRNFFGLRLDASAMPEMQFLAQAMWRAWLTSTPMYMSSGQWHLPYIDAEDGFADLYHIGDDRDHPAVWVSTARCARVSYMSMVTGKRSTVEEDCELYKKLVGQQPLHASPAEHQAVADPNGYHQDQWGNLKGWWQHRKMFPGEDCAPLPLTIVGDR